MGLFYTCEDTSAALSHYLDGVLPLAPFLKARAHLFGCPDCRVLLATLRALPALAAAALKETDVRAEAQRALDGALERLTRGEARPRAEAAPPGVEAETDLPMRLLAATHAALNRAGTLLAAPWPLPQDTLDRLPPPERWRWQEAENGIRKAELIEDPRRGVRLLLVYAPPSATLTPHRHLGSESILVLEGGLEDRGREYRPGAWIHYSAGSCHAPRMTPSGCWCLVREEGTVRFLGPAAWLRHLRHAS